MRPRTALAVLLILAASAALLAGCDSTTGGTATPADGASTAPTGGTGSAPSSNGSGVAAPKVRNPLDASKFTAAPCLSLTSSELAGLGMTNVRGGDNASITGAPICSWVDDTTGDGTGIAWEVGLGDGLSTIYSQKALQRYWQPTTVDGYPAVYADISDLRSQGTCSLSVGVSDKLDFISKFDTLQSALAPKACQLAAQAAADVIKKLGGA